MEQRILIALGLGAFVVIGGGWLLFSGTSDVIESDDATRDEFEQPAETELDERFAHIDRIETIQFYEDGMHTFVGEVNMPTPCDLLEVEATVMESMPEQIRLEFNVLNEDIDDDIACAQVITPQRFMVEVVASDEATVTAEFMGVPVELNLRDPQPDESPDDFELFIKG